ncbi:MAG: phasin family protein [Xanthobacteraceae bacterium]|nr:phasin family protein [Xanthobacteraceae bacterium]
MVKVEELQNYGKEQYESAVSSVNEVQHTLQAIVAAFGDYSKKSFEEGSAFLEKLMASKSLDKVIEVQTEYAKSSYETFMAESQKISALYAELAKQSFKPFEGFIGKFAPGSVR